MKLKAQLEAVPSAAPLVRIDNEFYFDQVSWHISHEG